MSSGPSSPASSSSSSHPATPDPPFNREAEVEMTPLLDEETALGGQDVSAADSGGGGSAEGPECSGSSSGGR